MAKRHHDGKSSHAHHGPHGLKHSLHDAEKYGDRTKAHGLMARDGAMISEDHSAACLLPTHVIEKEFAHTSHAALGGLKDLYTGETRQMAEDTAKLSRVSKPHLP